MLYLCATPIGNLEDITYRVVRILGEADVIYAEDTRRTVQLLSHLGLKKPLCSCHEHNEREKAKEIVALAAQGKNVAVVSDAGMPGISDPGAEVVAAAIEAGVPFTVAPGASAAVTSVVLSGLPCGRFVFEGFLPREKKPRRERLALLKAETRTTVLYESPFRLRDTLLELREELGDRPAAVCRELTKIHEEAVRGTLSELAAHYAEPPKGECVIVLSGGQPEEKALLPVEEQLALMQQRIDAGEKPKAAAKAAAQGISPSELYRLYVQREEE